MGGFTVISTLLVALVIVSITSFVTCNPSKRQITLDSTTSAPNSAQCIVDPGAERRTILLEGAATTWAATLPPMLATLQEISNTLKLECNPPAPMPSEPTGMDCSTLYAQGHNTSGIYIIGHHDHSVVHHKHFHAYCDMETDNGGWTVFQKRYDGSTSFYRSWEAYVDGFGHINGEQWLGLEKLNLLTSFAKYELRIDLERFNGETAYAKYANFQVGDDFDGYQLTANDYSGTAGDALNELSGQAFTTKYRDNDSSFTSNCAVGYQGAWWYSNCQSSNLNGRYLGVRSGGMVWPTWHGTEGLKSSTMKIRRKN